MTEDAETMKKEIARLRFENEGLREFLLGGQRRSADIWVRDINGRTIGSARSYGEAKTMHVEWLKQHRPEMVDRYGGINTSKSDEYQGMPMFYRE